MRQLFFIAAMTVLTATFLTACNDTDKKSESTESTTTTTATDTSKAADTTHFTDTASTRPVKTP